MVTCEFDSSVMYHTTESNISEKSTPVQLNDLSSSVIRSLENTGFHFRHRTKTFECEHCPAEVPLWPKSQPSVVFEHSAGCKYSDKPVKLTSDMMHKKIPKLLVAEVSDSVDLVRIISFDKWDHAKAVNVSELTKAGFLYKGPEDEIQCVFCRTCIKDWLNKKNPHELHREISPDCPSRSQRSCGNVPFKPSKV